MECLAKEGIELDEYKEIFKIINCKYIQYCCEWDKRRNDSINLRARCIRDIYSEDCLLNKQFQDYMNSFIENLQFLYLDILSEISKVTLNNIRGRVKDPQSILYKICKNRNKESGTIQIIKCLNDLLGIRIIDNDYSSNIEGIKKYLNSVEYKVKGLDRINGKYKGYHIYFKNNNNIYFPIELQIWDKKNEQTNIESHTLYKEEYNKWPQIYKNM